MYDRREKNVKIFKDTEQMCQHDPELHEAIQKSLERQQFFAHEVEMGHANKKACAGKVVVSGKKTIEASEVYAKQGKKVTVLNFASATSPGGGVRNGSSAQEESICRCTTLYPCLMAEYNRYYESHQVMQNPLYNNDLIYTPAVQVFKSDSDFPELLQRSEWWEVDVITCAAPNLRNMTKGEAIYYLGKNSTGDFWQDFKGILKSRIRRIFDIAVGRCDVLILGAFGCGAFRNPPQLVAEVFAELTEEYRIYFDVIEYAVFHMEHERENYEAFQEAMGRFI